MEIVIETGKEGYKLLDKLLTEQLTAEILKIKNNDKMKYPEKTIRWWYQNYLPSPIKEKAILNCTVDAGYLTYSLFAALTVGFNWEDSLEKEDYWQAVRFLTAEDSFPKITTQINWKTLEEHTPTEKIGVPYVLCTVWVCHPPNNVRFGVVEAVRWDVKNKCWLQSDIEGKWPAGIGLQITHFSDEVNIPT